MRSVQRLAFALGLFWAGSAIASETVSYQHGARGRLVKVAHTGTVNNGVSAEYAHDRADNRTNASITGAP